MKLDVSTLHHLLQYPMKYPQLHIPLWLVKVCDIDMGYIYMYNIVFLNYIWEKYRDSK